MGLVLLLAAALAAVVVVVGVVAVVVVLLVTRGKQPPHESGSAFTLQGLTAFRGGVTSGAGRGAPTHASLKLCIDLVPQTCWEKNLRKQMKRSRWDKLRKKVYAAQGNVCCLCGAAGRLNCHEAWSYDDERHIQKLMGFQAVCDLCHHVTHFGLATILAHTERPDGGPPSLDLEKVIEHFLKVNGVARDEFEAHKTEAFRLLRERSKHEWQTDLGEWASLVGQQNAEEEGPAP
jgi:hypothetical protein